MYVERRATDAAFEVIASSREYRRLLSGEGSEALDAALRDIASVLGLAGHSKRVVLSRAWNVRLRTRMDHASIQSLVFGKRGNAIGVSAADLVSELRTGNSLADWASLAPGAEMAIEIKSPYDNVKRLGSQLRDYRSMFPSVTVVVHEKNLRAVSGLTDADRAGLVVVRGTGSRARVELERSPSMHYGDIRLRHLLAVLRMRELAAVVERLSAQTVDASQVSAFLDAERLLEPFDLELVCSEVFNLVRRRRRLPYALAKAKVPIGIRPVLIGIDPPPGTLDYLVDWLAEGV